MKKNEDSAENLPNIISKAEKSVENVKDQRLKEIAFAKALDFLLETSSHLPEQKVKKSQGKRTKINASSKTVVKKDGPLTWIRELAEEDFFKEPKSAKDILKELVSRSHRLKATDITLPLQKLCHEKRLRKNKQKATDSEKSVFHWYNW